MTPAYDTITPDLAPTLPALLCERVRRTPDACAYRGFDLAGECTQSTTWSQTLAKAALWQQALLREGLVAGDRVALMLRNCLEWVLFDMAAAGLGLVTVPLFVSDRAENFAYIIEETEARLLFIEGVYQWEQIREVQPRLATLVRIVTLTHACDVDCDPRLMELSDWLPATTDRSFEPGRPDPDAVASIVYTSGTTGNPKGVVLSHRNFISNAYSSLLRVPVRTDALFLSFLPLSHTLERTAGYYAPLMAGACVVHVRSLEKLSEDLILVRPTAFISVPRVFERIHKKITAGLAEAPRWKRRLFFMAVEVGWRRVRYRQGKEGWFPALLLWPLLKKKVADRVMAALGGRVQLTISGGAPFNPEIARFFIALGLPVLQGYGLTETSPVVSVNSEADNRHETVGRPIDGVEVRVGADNELLVRGPNVMLGYWRNVPATKAAIDGEGWFHTGDQAVIDDEGFISITGRLKEIIVLANGEKVAPSDLETAIIVDPLFEQVLVIGEGKPFLSALVVLNKVLYGKLAVSLGREEAAEDDATMEQLYLERIAKCIRQFPGYAQIRRVHATVAPWEVDEGLVTATLKLRRKQLLERFTNEIDQLYAGH